MLFLYGVEDSLQKCEFPARPELHFRNLSCHQLRVGIETRNHRVLLIVRNCVTELLRRGMAFLTVAI